MEFALNNHPELTMLDITKKLFNNKFLANIKFTVEGQIIFAHSFELMKRSVVFQKELDIQLNETREVTIDNFTYKSFYEFICFLYTDECDINLQNGFELYKLATTYKFVKLENQVLDFLLRNTKLPLSTRLSLYALCITENYELPCNMLRYDIAQNLLAVMELDEFTTIQPKVMEDILKLDCVHENVTEIQIFNGLMHWMNTFCLSNDINLELRREKFDALLQLVRYSNLKMDEFREIMLDYCDLFEDKYICKFLKDLKQNVKLRCDCETKYENKYLRCIQTISETKFSVSKKVLFTGFRYGTGGNHVIMLLEKDTEGNSTDTIKLSKKFKDEATFKTVSLGETLVLKPNAEYTVQITYDNAGCSCWSLICRLTKLIVHDDSNALEIVNPGTTMFELFFKPVADEIIAESTTELPIEPMTDTNIDPSIADISSDGKVQTIFKSTLSETDSGQCVCSEVLQNNSAKEAIRTKSLSTSNVVEQQDERCVDTQLPKISSEPLQLQPKTASKPPQPESQPTTAIETIISEPAASERNKARTMKITYPFNTSSEESVE